MHISMMIHIHSLARSTLQAHMVSVSLALVWYGYNAPTTAVLFMVCTVFYVTDNNIQIIINHW